MWLLSKVKFRIPTFLREGDVFRRFCLPFCPRGIPCTGTLPETCSNLVNFALTVHVQRLRAIIAELVGPLVSINRQGIFMVASIASRCCRILFLMGGLQLPHWKVEDLASCYLYDYVCSCNLVYQMYLTEKPISRCTSWHWCNGRITQTHLLKLNGRCLE